MAELLGQMMSEGPEPKTTNKHSHILHLNLFTMILVSSCLFFNNIAKLLFLGELSKTKKKWLIVIVFDY